MSYNSDLQSNNSDLQSILNTINTLPNAIEIDDTLTQSGKAADAKAVGDTFDTLVGDKSVSTQISEAIADKVDKVNGKGLSTNDYTTTEKNKLAGIATGANKTTVDDALSSTSTNPVQNKVINAALADYVPISGGTMTGNLKFSSGTNKGVEWTTTDGSIFYIRPYNDYNRLQIVATPPNGSAQAIFKITNDGIIELAKALPINAGGTNATTAADARTNLGITPENIGAAPTSHTHATSAIKMTENASNNYINFPYAENVNTYRGIQWTTSGNTKHIIRPQDSTNELRINTQPSGGDAIASIKINSSGEVTFGKMIKNIQQATVTTNVAAASYSNVTVTFPTAFASAPYVMICFQDSSVAANFGSMSCAITPDTITKTGFKLRVYNSANVSRDGIGIKWLAIGAM